MGEILYGVEKENGTELLPVIGHSEVEALAAAAKLLHGRGGAGAIGKLIIAGYRVVRVKLVRE